MCINMYACMHVCMYVCIYICICLSFSIYQIFCYVIKEYINATHLFKLSACMCEALSEVGYCFHTTFSCFPTTLSCLYYVPGRCCCSRTECHQRVNCTPNDCDCPNAPSSCSNAGADEPCHCCCYPIEDRNHNYYHNNNITHVPPSRPHIPFKGNITTDPIPKPSSSSSSSSSSPSTSSTRSGSTVTSISLSTSTSTSTSASASACVSPRTSQSTHVPPFRAHPFASHLPASRASPLTLSTLPYTQPSSVLSRTSSLSSVITTRSNMYGGAVTGEPL